MSQYLRRPDTLQELQRLLINADPADTELFREIINSGVDLLRMPLKTLADEFGVSPASITRWRQGKNAPHPAVRRLMYGWMNKRVSTFLRRVARPAEIAAREDLSLENDIQTESALDARKGNFMNASATQANPKPVFPTSAPQVVAESGHHERWTGHLPRSQSWDHKTPGSKTPSSTTPPTEKAA